MTECELCGKSIRQMSSMDCLCNECYYCSRDWQERIYNREYYRYLRDLRLFAEYKDSL